MCPQNGGLNISYIFNSSNARFSSFNVSRYYCRWRYVRMRNYCLTGNRGVGVATPITVFEIHDYLNCYDIGPVFCSVILDVIVMTANNSTFVHTYQHRLEFLFTLSRRRGSLYVHLSFSQWQQHCSGHWSVKKYILTHQSVLLAAQWQPSDNRCCQPSTVLLLSNFLTRRMGRIFLKRQNLVF